jgi:hypothetical protein
VKINYLQRAIDDVPCKDYQENFRRAWLKMNYVRRAPR